MFGTVRRIKDRFGFIEGDDEIDYIFVPSSIQKTVQLEFKELKEGDRVQFEAILREKGWAAIEIRRTTTPRLKPSGPIQQPKR